MQIKIHSIGFFLITAMISFLATADPIPSGSAQSITVGCVITTSGTYRLSNDIVGTVTIAANNVTLNMDNRRLTGVGNAIEISNRQDITISNGIIANSATNGVLITTCTNIQLSDISFIANTRPVRATDSFEIIIDKCMIRESNNTNGSAANGGLISYLTVSNSIIKDCLFENNETVFIISLNGTINTQIISSDFESNTGASGLVAIRLLGTGLANMLIKDCVFASNTSPATFTAISSAGFNSGTLVDSCVITQNVTAGSFNGINISGSTVKNCIINKNSGTAGSTGISTSTNSVVITDCLIQDNASSASAAIGMSIGSGNSYVANNAVLFNVGVTSTGINNTTANNLILLNQAQGHGAAGANNYVGVPAGLISSLNPNTGVYATGPQIDNNVSLTVP